MDTQKTRIEESFDAEAVGELKEETDRNLSIGGAELAAQALKAGLVDELHLYLVPILMGNGKRALPDDVRLELRSLDEKRFARGAVHLSYRVLNPRHSAAAARA